MKKRGAAMHFEFIIAFVLFITFVTILLVYIKPQNSNQMSESTVLVLKENFEKETKTNLTRIFLREVSPDSCFSINLEKMDQNSKVIVRNLDQDLIPSDFSSPKSIRIKSGLGSPSFFFIYLSENLEEQSIPEGTECTPLTPESYTIGSFEKLFPLSEIKLKELSSRYNTDYNSLKSTLGIPQNMDFAIKLNLTDVNMDHSPVSEEAVSAKTFRFQIVSNDGRVENKEVIFKVW